MLCHCQCNITFDESVLVIPSDAQTEGELVTQSSQGATQKQDPPAPLPPAAPHIDPLKGFKALDPSEDQPLGRGHQMQKPSAYVWNIVDGAGSSTGHANATVYPKGVPIPTENTALLTLAEMGEDEAGVEGMTHHPFEFSMAAVTHSMGTDPSSLDDACSRKDWPHWDESIKQELDQHANLRTWTL